MDEFDGTIRPNNERRWRFVDQNIRDNLSAKLNSYAPPGGSDSDLPDELVIFTDSKNAEIFRSKLSKYSIRMEYPLVPLPGAYEAHQFSSFVNEVIDYLHEIVDMKRFTFGVVNTGSEEKPEMNVFFYKNYPAAEMRRISEISSEARRRQSDASSLPVPGSSGAEQTAPQTPQQSLVLSTSKLSVDEE